MNWNGAPVSFKPPPLNQHNVNSELPQKTDAILTSPLSNGPQPSAGEMPQHTLEVSRKSNGSCTAIFTHLQKPAHEIPSCSESIPECNVPSVTQQSQMETAIKTFEGTEIQDEKSKVGVLLVQAVNKPSSEMILEKGMNDLQEQNNTENTKVIGKKDSEARPEKYPTAESTLKLVENTRLHCEDLEAGQLETAPQKQSPENTNTPKDIITFTKIPKPESKVISIAELLRSQIKAIELTQDSLPVSTMSVPSKLTKYPIIMVKEVCHQAKDESTKSQSNVNSTKTKNETDASTGRAPDTNLKATLMKVYQQLHEKEQVFTSNEASTTVRTSHKPVLPCILFKDTNTATDTTVFHARMGKSYEVAMDTSQETVVPLKDDSVSWSGSKNIKDNPLSLPSGDRFIEEIQSVSSPPETTLQESGSLITAPHNQNNIQGERGTVMHRSKDGAVQGTSMATSFSQINLNNKLEMGMMGFSGQSKMEEPITNSSLRLQTCHQSNHEFRTTRPVKDILLTEQQISVVKEALRPDPFNTLTPESTPLIKKIDVTSPIPSATPQELASGARPKIPISNAEIAEAQESTLPTNSQTQKRELTGHSNKLSVTTVSPSLSQRSPLLQPAEEQTSVAERQSPLLTRKKMASDTQTQTQVLTEKTPTKVTPAEKDKHNPFKGKI